MFFYMGEQLEIEKICSLAEDSPTLAVSTDPNYVQEHPRKGEMLIAARGCIRARMMKEIFAEFPDEYELSSQQIPRLISWGRKRPVDAISIAVQKTIRRCINNANRNNAAYRSAAIEREKLARINVPYLDGITNPSQELELFMKHGTSTMLGMFEVVPEVHAVQSGKTFSRPELEALIPQSTATMFRSMTNLPGGFAVDIEDSLGLKHRDSFSGFTRYRRLQFDATRFRLVPCQQKGLQLDATAEVRADMEALIAEEGYDRHRRPHHGCLAHSVEMPPEIARETASVFLYIQDILTRELQEHWMHTVCDERCV